MKPSDDETLQLAASLTEVPRTRFLLSIKEQPQQASAWSPSTSKGGALTRPTRARYPRWPVEPPPVVEIDVSPSLGQGSDSWLVINSPNCFCVTELLDASSDQSQGSVSGLTGATVSSICKVKDSNNNNIEHGYFVFSDLWIRQEGMYKLRFTLFEMNIHSTGPHATKVCFVDSNIFPVKIKTQEIQPSPTKRQTYKDLQEAGLKIKMRKHVNKRTRVRDDWSASLSNVVFDAALQRIDDRTSHRIRGTNLGGSISRQPKPEHPVNIRLPLTAALGNSSEYLPATSALLQNPFIAASSRSSDDTSSYVQDSHYNTFQPVFNEYPVGFDMAPSAYLHPHHGIDVNGIPVQHETQFHHERRAYPQLHSTTLSHPDMQGVYGNGVFTQHQFGAQQYNYRTGY